MKTDHCGDPTHPAGVDDLDYHLRQGQDLPTPDGYFECWVCPVLPDGTSARHRWHSPRNIDHLVLMRATRAESGEGRIEERWNNLTVRQRHAYLTAFDLDPAFLGEEFNPKTLRLKARKPNNPVFE